MPAKVYKLVATLQGVEEKDLPQLVAALQVTGRRLHAEVMLITGSTLEIVLYGEDLVYEPKGK